MLPCAGFTNGILNNFYGVENRNAINHAPHFLDRHILSELAKKFEVVVNQTTSHKFRTFQDFQFTLGYFHYVVEEGKSRPLDIYMRELDMDNDGLLNIGRLPFCFPIGTPHI